MPLDDFPVRHLLQVREELVPQNGLDVSRHKLAPVLREVEDSLIPLKAFEGVAKRAVARGPSLATSQVSGRVELQFQEGRGGLPEGAPTTENPLALMVRAVVLEEHG